MRILFVSNGNYKHQGERSHLFDARIRNGLVRQGHHVYFMSDRDTAREGGIIGKLFARSRVSECFVNICKQFQPDMILLGQADWISVDDLHKAKAILPHVKIAAYCIDIVFYKHIEQTIISKLSALDAVFCTTAGRAIAERFKRPHLKVAYIPNPCDASIDYVRAEQDTTQEYDVFWAMRGMRSSYQGDPRFEIPRFLAKQPSLKIAYYGFDDRPILLGRDYYKAIANAKGGLNISVSRLNEMPNDNPENIYLYSSDRIGHYFGCGLLVYILRGFGLEELLQENHHAVYFSDAIELADKITFYRNHDSERQKIARAGAEYYRTFFNEFEVARYMIQVTFALDTKTPQDFAWKTDIF
jgi:glycosyltransferase involved in cell wall biosynthesis